MLQRAVEDKRSASFSSTALHPQCDASPSSERFDYFDSNSNFYLTKQTNIDDLEYATALTSIAIGEVQHGNTLPGASAGAPQLPDVVESAANLLTTLPLSAVTRRSIPLPVFGGSSGGDIQEASARHARLNLAREKWSSISFASDKAAVRFHEELTAEIKSMRLGMRRANTTVVFPDTVSDEALSYFQPSERYGHGWEMFDAKKHVDVEALDRVAKQRLNAIREGEARAARQEAKLKRGATSFSMQRSPSMSPSRRGVSPEKEVSLARSPSHAGSNVSGFSGSPSGVPRPAAEKSAEDVIWNFDVRRAVDDEQVAALFHPDEVAEQIETLKWDFKEFRPPAEWKREHQKKMNALNRRAAAWRPLELRREPYVPVESVARVTSMPALTPFFSSGITELDPKLPIPAAMQGSGVAQAHLMSPHFSNAFVVRPDTSQQNASARKGSTAAIPPVPVIIDGMTWGEVLQRMGPSASPLVL